MRKIEGIMKTLTNTNRFNLKKISFEYAFRPVYCFSRFAGLWPFSIVHDANGEIQKACVALYDILWSILMICFNLTLAYFTYKKLKEAQEKVDDLLRFIVLNIFLMSSLLVGAIGIVLDLINCNKLVDILGKLHKFDNEVRQYFNIFS